MQTNSSWVLLSFLVACGGGGSVGPDGGDSNNNDDAGAPTNDSGHPTYDASPSDGGGPMAYTAPPDTNAHGYSALAAPDENVLSTDPDFVHTSSGGLCNGNLTCFIRPTGPSLWSQIPSTFPQVTGVGGFSTESGSV